MRLHILYIVSGEFQISCLLDSLLWCTPHHPTIYLHYRIKFLYLKQQVHSCVCSRWWTKCHWGVKQLPKLNPQSNETWKNQYMIVKHFPIIFTCACIPYFTFTNSSISKNYLVFPRFIFKNFSLRGKINFLCYFLRFSKHKFWNSHFS